MMQCICGALGWRSGGANCDRLTGCLTLQPTADSSLCHSPTPQPLQAWRAVDKAYVDKQFNGQSWFRVSDGGGLGFECFQKSCRESVNVDVTTAADPTTLP